MKEKTRMMNLTFKDSTVEIYETDTKVAGIVKCNGANNKYYVTLRNKCEKSQKTNKTKCDYDTAYSIVKEFLK